MFRDEAAELVFFGVLDATVTAADLDGVLHVDAPRCSGTAKMRSPGVGRSPATEVTVTVRDVAAPGRWRCATAAC